MKVAIIGAGAAGIFAAIQVKLHHPKSEVSVHEKSQKLLSKVKVSGGGRCNVTNNSTSISVLSKAYPRGGKLMKKLLKRFNTTDIRTYFENKGVKLYSQDDQRVFPISDDSQTIIDALLKDCKSKGIQIKLGSDCIAITPKSEKLLLRFKHQNEETFDKVIVASGGSPKESGLEWLKELGHEIITPQPSLFSFNMPNEKIKSLMGISMPHTHISIVGEKLKSTGPVLITHWGMSGPAILKLSAFGARVLAAKNYHFQIQIAWLGEQNFELISEELLTYLSMHPQKKVGNIKPFGLPERLWHFLLEKSEISMEKPCMEIGKKAINKLTQVLVNDLYEIQGKTTFKEEFVTCGGISLESIHQQTMESKVVKGLYFAGEVLNIDGITGGYNFQAAWTTGFIAGQLKESN